MFSIQYYHIFSQSSAFESPRNAQISATERARHGICTRCCCWFWHWLYTRVDVICWMLWSISVDVRELLFFSYTILTLNIGWSKVVFFLPLTCNIHVTSRHSYWCYFLSLIRDASAKFRDLWKRKHETGQWLEMEAAAEMMSSRPDFTALNGSGIILPNMAFASPTELNSENNGKASSGTWQFLNILNLSTCKFMDSSGLDIHNYNKLLWRI